MTLPNKHINFNRTKKHPVDWSCLAQTDWEINNQVQILSKDGISDTLNYSKCNYTAQFECHLGNFPVCAVQQCQQTRQIIVLLINIRSILIPETLHSAPHRHQQKVSAAHVCRVTFKYLPQPLRSNIRSFGSLGQFLEIPPFVRPIIAQ